ncbi:hypothetical protein F4859DRAFT_516203 [Xylaria cf. heliscus]|nr:hypothetical protein F4859DRAFT_516203 [Xylaria cf. heliscus]
MLLVFNDVVENAIPWCTWKVGCILSPVSSEAQALLLHGPGDIQEISSTEIYEDEYRALDAIDLRSDNPPVIINLRDFAPEGVKHYIKQPFFNGPEYGQVDAWRWAHLESP